MILSQTNLEIEGDFGINHLVFFRTIEPSLAKYDTIIR